MKFSWKRLASCVTIGFMLIPIQPVKAAPFSLPLPPAVQEEEPPRTDELPALSQPISHHFDQPNFDPKDYLSTPTAAEEITNQTLLGMIPRGGGVKVLDIQTGLSFHVSRLGGDLHMDVEPATKADTQTFMRIVGMMSWDRRPIVLLTDDGNAYAASMNGMAHLPQRITTNGFPGHFCIHVRESRCHGSNYLCPKHQAAVTTAQKADLTQYTF